VLTMVTLDMWRRPAIGRRKFRKLRLVVIHMVLVVLVLEDLRGVLLVQRQEILMLLHRLVASTSTGAVGTVTQSSALIGSATASQSSTLGPPTAPSSGTYSWYLDSSASFHMTPHSAHLSLRPCHCIVHIADGSPLSVAGRDTLSSDSFHVPDVSLVYDLTMQLMSAGQIADHDCRVILDPDVCYIQDRRTGHLVGTGPRRRDSQRL
jgi:hypothetical protein